MAKGSRKVTPTAREIAALWLSRQLSEEHNTGTISDSGLQFLADSRVSPIKGTKIRIQIEKLTKQLTKRVIKILEKYHAKIENAKSVPAPGKNNDASLPATVR